MTLTQRNHPVLAVQVTSVWRGLVIAMAVLLHLLLAGKAHADVMAQPAAGHLALSQSIGISGHAGQFGHAGNRTMDSEMQVEIAPSEEGGFYAGYRMVDLKMQRSTPLLNTAVSGPFIGGFIRF